MSRAVDLAGERSVTTGLGGVVLSSAMWAYVVATLLELAGIVLFRGNGSRTGALFARAMAAVSIAYTRA